MRMMPCEFRGRIGSVLRSVFYMDMKIIVRFYVLNHCHFGGRPEKIR